MRISSPEAHKGHHYPFHSTHSVSAWLTNASTSALLNRSVYLRVVWQIRSHGPWLAWWRFRNRDLTAQLVASRGSTRASKHSNCIEPPRVFSDIKAEQFSNGMYAFVSLAIPTSVFKVYTSSGCSHVRRDRHIMLEFPTQSEICAIKGHLSVEVDGMHSLRRSRRKATRLFTVAMPLHTSRVRLALRSACAY